MRAVEFVWTLVGGVESWQVVGEVVTGIGQRSGVSGGGGGSGAV
jgi:hypothetical protein